MLTEKEKINKQRNLFMIETILLKKTSLSVVKETFVPSYYSYSVKLKPTRAWNC